jgi:hypothetical protein
LTDISKKTMKTILTLALFFVVGITFGQIPKQSSSITIMGDSTTKEKIIELLVTNGFGIKNANNYAIQTEEKQISYDNFLNTWKFDINVSFVNNKFTFSIFWNAQGYRDKCSYKGFKSGADKVGFNELNNILNTLGYELTYNQF